MYITFPLKEDKNTNLIVWTTTPWTLPSNLACAVNPEMEYVKFKYEPTGLYYIVAVPRLDDVFKQLKWNKKQRKEETKLVGKDLDGKEYVPLFDYFYHLSE